MGSIAIGPIGAIVGQCAHVGISAFNIPTGTLIHIRYRTRTGSEDVCGTRLQIVELPSSFTNAECVGGPIRNITESNT